MENEELFNKKIRDAKIITIWGHTMPDPDCYGCQIGLRDLLRLNFPDKKVYAIGSGVPVLFDRLKPMDSDVSEGEIASSLAILVDVSCIRRVEDQRVTKAKDFLKFDHHMFNDGEEFPYLSIVDPERVSAAEIIAEWAERNSLIINKDIAEALYIGIVTDSGDFRFHGTCPKTFETAGKLFAYGVKPYSLLSPVSTQTSESIRFRAFLIDQAKIDGQVCYVYLKKEDYESRGMSYAAASSLVNILACKKTNIFCLFTEDGKGDIRGEIRSEYDYPVQPTARKFGGGGHMFAAGLTLKVGGKPSVEDVVKALNQIERMQ